MANTILIAHNIRSTYNIGSIFRTAEGFGVNKIILSGYSPYPKTVNDTRLPHIAEKMTNQIHKTALGAENMVPFEYKSIPNFEKLKKQGYQIVALEQNKKSIRLDKFSHPDNIALLLGEEVNGIEADLLNQCDCIIEIPMKGKKESFNVSVAIGIALYQLSI